MSALARCALLAGVLVSNISSGQSPHQHEDDAHAHPRPPSDGERSPSGHVPPDPPQTMLGEMSNERMIELMGMDDRAPHTMVAFDQLEWREVRDDDALAWDAYVWFGGDYDKVRFKTEGTYVDADYAARHELLWDRVVSRWWSVQAGVRYDESEGPSRTWFAIGLQGLAPYWFEVEATAYIGDEGRTALRTSVERDLLLTQRLILTPEIELTMYGKEDRPNRLGSGLAEVELGLRLRYEVRREFAPYVGVQWTRLNGATAEFAQAAGRDEDEAQAVAGVRVWF